MLQSPLLLKAQGALSFPSPPPSLRRPSVNPFLPLFFLILRGVHSSFLDGFVQSLSAAFTQNRLFRPECVSAGILMLTYLSTLRSKSRRFLFRPKNAYFANSPNTSHRPRFALASIRKATPRPAFDGELRKTKMHRCAVDGGSQNAKFIEQPFCHDYWLKLTLPRAKVDSGIYASRREIT